MKSKLRLYINLVVICLCIFAMVVGVYSATTTTLSVSGSIGFKAHDCELSVSGTKTGYASEDLLTYETDNVAIDMDTTTEGLQDTGKVSGKGGDDTISTLNLGTLNFTDLAGETIPPIVITLTFTNLSPFQVSAFVTVDETTLTNIEYTRQYTHNTTTNGNHSGAIILDPSSGADAKKAVTFTLTFKVATPEQSIDPSSTLTINANFAKYDNTAIPTTYEDTTQGLTYTRSGGSWSVKGNNPTATISVAPVMHNLPVTTVAGNAFESNTTITDVTLPNTVTSVGSSAFEDCTALANISMANSVKGIAKYAFYKCTSLTSIYMPNSVTNIGDSAFYGCSGLTKVNISSVESWCNINFQFDDSNPFYYAAQKDLYLNDELLTDLVIPDTITKIKNYAFYNCTSVKSLTMHDKITSIGARVFSNCVNLTGSLVIPDSVTSIGIYAFYNCSGFNGTLTIGDSVSSIGERAFSNCSNLISVNIPSTVTSIGEYAFDYCSKLSKVNISSLENWYKINFGYNSNPISYARNLYLNNELITDLVIPNSVTKLNDYIFYGCETLKSLAIPDSVTSIGKYAFNDCSGLTGNLTIPDGVTSIGNYAFSDCSGLTGNLTIPDGVTSIGDGVFSGCRGFTGDLIIPNGITDIGRNAFSTCSGFSGLTIPNSVKNIDFYAFNGCSGLKKVNIFSLESWCKIVFDDEYCNPIYYAKNLYLNDVLVEDLVIPESITAIKSYAFYNCTSIKTLTLNNITSIGMFSFFGCNGLTGNLIIPDSVTSMNSGAFRNCKNLTGVSIGNGLKSIAYYGFLDCRSLTNVTIGSNVTNINDYAFSGCKNLTIICNGASVPTATRAFQKYSYSGTTYAATTMTAIYVQSSLVDTYKTTTGWSAYASVIQAIPES